MVVWEMAIQNFVALLIGFGIFFAGLARLLALRKPKQSPKHKVIERETPETVLVIEHKTDNTKTA